jgi:DNA mismatch endonuclease, patch repair protein
VADIVSKEIRSRMMSGIRGKNTKPETIIRSALHAAGLRYRLHVAALPGKPDLVLPKYKTVIFVHGCFWHGHNCHLFKLPSTRTEFWSSKIEENRMRDTRVIERLESIGWRVGVIWECALKGKERRPISEVVEQCLQWLESEKPFLILI